MCPKFVADLPIRTENTGFAGFRVVEQNRKLVTEIVTEIVTETLPNVTELMQIIPYWTGPEKPDYSVVTASYAAKTAEFLPFPNAGRPDSRSGSTPVMCQGPYDINQIDPDGIWYTAHN